MYTFKLGVRSSLKDLAMIHRTFLDLCVCVCVRACVSLCVWVRACVCVCVCTCTPLVPCHPVFHTCMHTCTHARMHACTHAHLLYESGKILQSTMAAYVSAGVYGQFLRITGSISCLSLVPCGPLQLLQVQQQCVCWHLC